MSSGFAFVHADSTTDIMAVEAVPLEQLDVEAVKKVSRGPCREIFPRLESRGEKKGE